MAPHLSEVIDFVREETRTPSRVQISGLTRLEGDLGVTGDDGDDLLQAAEARFSVSFGEDLRLTFGLEPGEVLFGPEGLPIPGVSWMLRKLGLDAPTRVVDLTVEQLHQAIARSAEQFPEP